MIFVLLSIKSLGKVHSKASNYSHGNSSRSSIQMLPIISNLVEKQVPEFGKFWSEQK